MTDVTDLELEAFCAALRTRVRSYADDETPTVKVTRGPTYARISCVNSYSNSVYCFIDLATGAILKADGWKAPAKQAPRGNIRDEDPLKLCGPHSVASAAEMKRGKISDVRILSVTHVGSDITS